MAYIDPWSGYNRTTETLADAAKVSEEQRRNALAEARQAELDARARTEWNRKEGDIAAIRGLESQLATKKTVTSQETNPAYSDYLGAHTEGALRAALQPTPEQAAQSSLEGLVSGKPPQEYPAPTQTDLKNLAMANAPAPPAYTTTTNAVPYSDREKALARASLLQSQGNYEGASKAAEQSYNIAEQYPKHLQEMGVLSLTMLGNNALMLKDPKKAVQLTAEQMAEQGFPPEAIEMMRKTEIGPAGIVFTPLPSGDRAIHSIVNGKWVQTIEKAKEPTDIKITTPEFEETNKVADKLQRTTHQWSFHDTGAYTKQQLFKMWQDMGGTDEAAKQLSAKTGGLVKEKKENLAATPIQVTVDARRAGAERFAEAKNLPTGWMRSNMGGFYKEVPDGKGGVTMRRATPEEATMLAEMGHGEIQDRSASRTAGGVRSMVAQGAYDQFMSDAKTLTSMATKIDKQLLSSYIPVIGNSTTVREAEIAVKKNLNNKDAAAYYSKALATAEALGNALGGQGSTSDFKLKLARDLIKYGYEPETLQAVVDAHAGSLKAKATSYKGFGGNTSPTPAAPAVGSVIKGYKFQGGDPSKKENWKKI